MLTARVFFYNSHTISTPAPDSYLWSLNYLLSGREWIKIQSEQLVTKTPSCSHKKSLNLFTLLCEKHFVLSSKMSRRQWDWFEYGQVVNLLAEVKLLGQDLFYSLSREIWQRGAWSVVWPNEPPTWRARGATDGGRRRAALGSRKSGRKRRRGRWATFSGDATVASFWWKSLERKPSKGLHQAELGGSSSSAGAFIFTFIDSSTTSLSPPCCLALPTKVI